MPSDLVLPLHFPSSLTAGCVLLANDITKLVHLNDRSNESFPRSYCLCYNVSVHNCQVVPVIMSFAIERAAMLLLPTVKNLGAPLECRAYFDGRVRNLNDTMLHWRNTVGLSSGRSEVAGIESIRIIAEEAWQRALKRVIRARHLMLALMSSGLCAEMAFKIKNDAM